MDATKNINLKMRRQKKDLWLTHHKHTQTIVAFEYIPMLSFPMLLHFTQRSHVCPKNTKKSVFLGEPFHIIINMSM